MNRMHEANRKGWDAASPSWQAMIERRVGHDMSSRFRWKSGEQIVLRELWQGKIWSVKPEILVQDTPNMLALYLPAGTPWKRPVSRDGTPLRLTPADWVLADYRWPIENLRLVTPGASHSVLLLWSEGFDRFLRWYVNLEQPLRRTAIGFDYIDQVLDIEISRDLTKWRWKDEDELEEAQAQGLISGDRARELRAEGEHVIELMKARKPPFNQGWESWRPDPAWSIPELPEGWDIIHELRRNEA